ncbi:MAG: LysM peptidoglycan-binding domain-containing protein [Myxococcota bacterium]
MSQGLAFSDESSRNGGGVGATEKIAQVLQASGIDAPASLYDEALEMARDGKYAAATERLRMLLCLDPNDADASLLLGKVLATMGKWQESLSYLDGATRNGAVLPPGLREHVEGGLRRELQAEEERRARVATRERSELVSLRREVKDLRRENADLNGQINELNYRVRVWSSITAVIAGSASALLLATMLFGGDDPPQDVTAPTEPALVTAPVENLDVPNPPDAPNGQPTVAPMGDLAAAPIAEPAPGEAGPDFPVTYTVKSGDNLSKISQKFYGRASLHGHIKQANDLDTVALSVGQKLTIPEPPDAF